MSIILEILNMIKSLASGGGSTPDPAVEAAASSLIAKIRAAIAREQAEVDRDLKEEKDIFKN